MLDGLACPSCPCTPTAHTAASTPFMHCPHRQDADAQAPGQGSTVPYAEARRPACSEAVKAAADAAPDQGHTATLGEYYQLERGSKGTEGPYVLASAVAAPDQERPAAPGTAAGTAAAAPPAPQGPSPLASATRCGAVGGSSGAQVPAPPQAPSAAAEHLLEVSPSNVASLLSLADLWDVSRLWIQDFRSMVAGGYKSVGVWLAGGYKSVGVWQAWGAQVAREIKVVGT